MKKRIKTHNKFTHGQVLNLMIQLLSDAVEVSPCATWHTSLRKEVKPNSLGPVDEFECTSFRTDNLNCFEYTETRGFHHIATY